MNTSLYRQRCQLVWQAVEDLLDQDYADFDCKRSGNVLEIECERNEKIIVNLQEPLEEIWLASKLGAHHFSWENELWLDSRSHQEFFQVLKQHLLAAS